MVLVSLNCLGIKIKITESIEWVINKLMKGGANMRKYNISLFALIALISLLFLTNFVGAVYVSGYVTPNGSV